MTLLFFELIFNFTLDLVLANQRRLCQRKRRKQARTIKRKTSLQTTTTTNNKLTNTNNRLTKGHNTFVLVASAFQWRVRATNNKDWMSGHYHDTRQSWYYNNSILWISSFSFSNTFFYPCCYTVVLVELRKQTRICWWCIQISLRTDGWDTGISRVPVRNTHNYNPQGRPLAIFFQATEVSNIWMRHRLLVETCLLSWEPCVFLNLQPRKWTTHGSRIVHVS